MVLIIMGVAGAGKTTVGKSLASRLGWMFYDADDFHPKENIEKIEKGAPLTDEDRAPWLEALRALIAGLDTNAVIACSALKKKYRDILTVGGHDVRFVYLHGDKEIIRERLLERKGHFAGPEILEGQLDALEEPEDAISVDIGQGADVITDEIVLKLGLKGHA